MKGQRNEKKLTPISTIINNLMDLNHIKLPATVIADLYKSSLVEREENLTKKEAPATLPKQEIRPANTEIEVKRRGMTRYCGWILLNINMYRSVVQ